MTVVTWVTLLVLTWSWRVEGDVCGVGDNVTWVERGNAEIVVRSEKFETEPGLVAGVVYNGMYGITSVCVSQY